MTEKETSPKELFEAFCRVTAHTKKQPVIGINYHKIISNGVKFNSYAFCTKNEKCCAEMRDKYKDGKSGEEIILGTVPLINFFEENVCSCLGSQECELEIVINDAILQRYDTDTEKDVLYINKLFTIKEDKEKKKAT